jgi:hypothetical protein
LNIIGQTVIVKVVPRIAPSGATSGKGNRPPAKPFYPEDVDNAEEAPQKKIWRDRMVEEKMTYWKNNWYLDGFLYKAVSLAMITAENVKPDFIVRNLFIFLIVSISIQTNGAF